MIYIGIDGGGTKTEAAAVDKSGHIIARSKSSGCNPNDIGIDASAGIITDCIMQLGCGVSCIFAGIAGAINNRELLLCRLQSSLPNCKIELQTDANNMISCEIPEGDGACVIAGTGSSCFVRKSGQLRRIGGWGYLIDAGGDGFSIGKAVLDAALRECDGRGQKTLLTGLIVEKAGKPAEKLVTEIYSGGRAYIASFAGLALEAARMGDAVAERIMQVNAGYIAELLDTACEYAGADIPFVMGGGINAHFQPEWNDLILSAAKRKPRLILPEMPPVYGAVVCALVSDGAKPDENFKSNFRGDYFNEA